MITLKYYGFLLACAFATANAFGQTDAEQGFRELVHPRLLLSSDLQSHSESFQVEIRSRLVDNRGPAVEQRAILERSKNNVAALLLTPNGLPTSLLVGHTFLLVDGEELKAFQGGRFHCRGGSCGDNQLGINIRYAGDSSKESGVAVDFNALSEPFMIEGANYGWDTRSKRHWVTTPNGAHLSLHVPNTHDVQFPIRAALAIVPTRRDKSSYIEVGISNIYVRPPPRTLLETDGWHDIPMGSASFAEVEASLSDAGVSFDEDDESARRLATIMLDGFKTDASSRVSVEARTGVRELLDSFEGAPESPSRRALAELRSWGEKHVWGHLQRPIGTPFRFRVDYDRFTAAAATEIALKPSMTQELHDRLVEIAGRRDLDDSIRSDAIDLIGYFGLPILSTRLDQIEQVLEDEDSPTILAAFSSVRARQAVATDADVERLHHAVSDHSLSQDLRTIAIESLSLLGELERYQTAPEPLLDGQLLGKGITRRVRVLAANPNGQRILLNLLERKDSRLKVSDGLTALLESLSPNDENWGDLARLASGTALDTELPDDVRILANKIVHQDQRLLASGYTDEFFRSVAGSKNRDFVYGALWNMIELGRGNDCFDHVRSMQRSRDLAERSQAATLLSALALVEWKSKKQLSSSFWLALDAVFHDPELAIQRVGPVLILMLVDDGVAVPKSYITPTVQAGLATGDPGTLAVSCLVVSRLSRTDFILPIMREAQTKAEIVEWFNGNPELARRELKDWYSDYESRQLQRR